MKNILQSIFVILIGFSSLDSTAETVTYFVNDAVGSPVAAMDQNGNLLWRENYNPYGDGRNKPSQNQNDIGFTGHQKDDATGLVYMQARYYDPIVGRFYALDAVGALEHLGKNNTDGFNRYAYANNNPYKYIDPDGNETVLAVGGHTDGNPFGHIATIINGTVYSYGSAYSGGKDWGVPQGSYFNNENNSSGNSQNSLRETKLYTLNINAEQEANLESYFQNNDPNESTYGLLNHSCVTSLEKAFEAAGILDNQPGNVEVLPNGDLVQAGAPSSRSPQGLLNQVKSGVGISSVVTVGAPPDISKVNALVNGLREQSN